MWDLQDLFRRHSRELNRFLQRRVSSPEVAADLTQELFLRLLTATPAAPVLDRRSYLFRAAGNLAINHRKRERLVEFVADPDLLDRIADETPNAERALLSRQQLLIVAAALTEFPPVHREIFMLSRVDGLSHADIGRQLGLPRQRVFDYLVRIVVRLQARLQETAQETSYEIPR
ncbi:MAG: sigma-70 family RNA polymerase sigma factor [Pseudolabrys sp.]|nr:sigma-70 family RNA polymerase sigma factor [Pseudolabrys sp.]